VEEIRQSIRELRARAEFESSNRPRIPPPHAPSEAIDLPADLRRSGSAGSPTAIAPSSVTAPLLTTPLPILAPGLAAPQ
jgi:hypothetical protein